MPEALAQLDEHAAAGGVAVVTGTLGDAVGTSAVVAEWARGTVLAVPLVTGSSSLAAGEAEPLVKGIEKPMAVLTSSDGAVLVGDWAAGTIFRIARFISD